MSSFNVKFIVPSDIPTHNGFILSEYLKSQKYLNDISEWTMKEKMKLNTNKSKIMIFILHKITSSPQKSQWIENQLI